MTVRTESDLEMNIFMKMTKQLLIIVWQAEEWLISEKKNRHFSFERCKFKNRIINDTDPDWFGREKRVGALDYQAFSIVIPKLNCSRMQVDHQISDQRWPHRWTWPTVVSQWGVRAVLHINPSQMTWCTTTHQLPIPSIKRPTDFSLRCWTTKICISWICLWTMVSTDFLSSTIFLFPSILLYDQSRRYQHRKRWNQVVIRNTRKKIMQTRSIAL